MNMQHLQQYVSSDDDDNSDSGNNSLEDIVSHLKPLGPGKSIAILQNKMQVCSAPNVVPTVSVECSSIN